VHPLAPRDFLELGGLVGVDAAGDDQRRPAFDAPGDLQRGGHLGRGQRDDGQVGPCLRQVGQRAAGVDVHKLQATGKTLRPQGRTQVPAHARSARQDRRACPPERQ
jgi:hypothetical protein